MAVSTSDADLSYQLTPIRLGIDTHQEPVVYLQATNPACQAAGFSAGSRIQVCIGSKTIQANLAILTRSSLLQQHELGLSEAAWIQLAPSADATAHLQHPDPVPSLSHLRHKVYGHRLNDQQTQAIIDDIVARRYSDVHLSSFVTACAADSLNQQEITALTRAMLQSGKRLDWGKTRVVDKHCVGGLAGNRTTPLVVAIVAACGGTMPKTSSRAITSPAGTADTMATMTRVNLDMDTLRQVVRQEGACLAWGGAVHLSPADDILIRIERQLDLDSEGQMVASILSKKAAAGSTHVLIDLPVGPTAKVRSVQAAEKLGQHLQATGQALGLEVRVRQTDGSQPIGRGIGPALEAHDVLAVLRNTADAPEDLQARALLLAGELLELAELCLPGEGEALAARTLASGAALQKFLAICQAQGGFTEPGWASYRQDWQASRSGQITGIDNRLLSQLAKLAGAPETATAGLSLHVRLGQSITAGQPLLTLHADTPGELQYALQFLQANPNLIEISA